MTCEDAVNNGYRGIKISTGESFRYSNKEIIYYPVDMEESSRLQEANN